VLSIWTLHQDASGFYRPSPQSSRQDWARGFEPFALGKVTLFKLAGTGEAEKFAQYVLLVKGARASHPLEEQNLPPAGPPPVVVKTYPESGAKDVPPGPTELRVTFSKEMTPGSWSFVTATQGEYPKTTGQPHYEADRRTCVFTIILEPAKTYALWINSERFNSFSDTAGQPAKPYLLVFRTRER
jgi:RNA polymerase sigma-70 factor (ECF subfamily)